MDTIRSTIDPPRSAHVPAFPPALFPEGTTKGCQRAAFVASRWLDARRDCLPPAGLVLVCRAEPADGPIAFPPRGRRMAYPWGLLQEGDGYAIGLALSAPLAEAMRADGQRRGSAEHLADGNRLANVLDAYAALDALPVVCIGEDHTTIYGVVATGDGFRYIPLWEEGN